jgi:hypothetical protein
MVKGEKGLDASTVTGVVYAGAIGPATARMGVGGGVGLGLGRERGHGPRGAEARA